MKSMTVIYPASKAPDDTLDRKILELKNLGFSISFKKPDGDPSLPWISNPTAIRLREISTALLDPSCDFILCARGGYGASDLLDDLPWADIQDQKPKLLCGFSDISSLHAAIVTKLGWECLHCPMPATDYWGPNQATKTLLELLTKPGPWDGSLAIKDRFGADSVEGILFGGCLTVLTHLIGTPYLPDNLKEKILFFEDIGESPPKILRCLNQWHQAGLLSGVNGILMGSFTGLEASIAFDKTLLCQEIAKRYNIPVFSTEEFGHSEKNLPILLNSEAKITRDHLYWQQRKNYENQA